MVPKLPFWIVPLLTGRGLCSYLGQLVGPFTDTVPGVRGTVWAADKSTLVIHNFTADGSDTGTFIYVGTLNNDGTYTKTGYPLTNQRGVVEPVGREKGLMVLQFPEGKSLLTVDWVGVLSRRNKKMIGRTLVTEFVKRRIPKPQRLGRLEGRLAMSGDVIALDSRSVMIKDLVYSGDQPDTHFTVGTGDRPSPYGTKVPDEEGRMESLKTYRNRTVILTLPPSVDLMSVSWLSIWSQSLQTNFASVSIPRDLMVPPSPQSLGISPQLPHPDPAPGDGGAEGPDDESKLNCEVLSAPLGLQLRWSLAGDSIILQIVGNMGSDMYMAFGVKAGQKEEGGSAAGDVIVGWINSATGQGGLDDYFLSGTSTCSDGAESCPDTTKQGGEKNVEMLNSVSRDNYTMLTFRRPLKAEDQYDTTILTSQPQEVFWSVGYKMAVKRLESKPLKNIDPIFVDFGRLSLWNCPTESSKDSGELPRTTVRYQDTTKRPEPEYRKPEMTSMTVPERDLGEDQDSEPSFQDRKRVWGAKPRPAQSPVRRPSQDYDGYDYSGGSDYVYDLGDGGLEQGSQYDRVEPTNQAQQGFSAQEIAEMKKRFEAKLAKDFPARADGQKTTLELIPELGQFVEPFFPKGPPPGATPRGGPPGPATHPPPAMDENWNVPSTGCNSTENSVFYLQIGPAAARRGNQGLGRFGQSWYVNGDVAPDIYLVRGKQYTFIVEGGLGTNQEGIIHPFYLTSDNEGGYGTKSDYEARREEVFGGLSKDRDGQPAPTVMGRLCHWDSPRAPATYATYADFKDGLRVQCEDTGSPGILRFEPTYDMPDTLYYQSFSEKLMGGKVHLMDQCHEILKSEVGGQDSRKRLSPSTTRLPSQPEPARRPLKETSYRTPSKPTKTTRPPRKRYSTKSKTRSRKKCPRKLDSVMPTFEHFPVKEIMKEGVKDDCQDANDMSRDWEDDGEDGDADSDIMNDYGDDYVQPTKKPLIFKQFLNKTPLSETRLSTRRKYDSKTKSSDGGGYNQIPDLPPPSRFPDMFSNNGFMFSNNNEPKLSVKRPPTKTSWPPTTTTIRTKAPVREPTTTNKIEVEVDNYGNSGMYDKPMDAGQHSTARPKHSTPRHKYKSPTGTMYTSPKPVYTTMRQAYDYHTTPRPVYTSQRQSYDYHTSARPMYTTPRMSYDYHTTSKSIYTTPRRMYDYHSSPKPLHTTPRLTYDYGTSARPAYTTARTPPRIPSDSPYKFYTPSPIPRLEEEARPAPLPPPGNFPSFFGKGSTRDEEETRRKEKDRRPLRKFNSPSLHVPQPPSNPLQSLLNPLRSIFGGGLRQKLVPRKDDRPPPRRREPEKEDIPAPLPPPKDFPEFEDNPNINDLVSGSRRPGGGRRKRKRTRRPMIDKSLKYQRYQDEHDDSLTFHDLLLQRQYGSGQDGGRRKEENRRQEEVRRDSSFVHMSGRRRPLFDRHPKRSGHSHGHGDQQYSPSENEDTLAVVEEAPPVKYSQPSNLGLGVFNPKAIEPESGFTPVMPNQGNAPSLAFSIFDDYSGSVSGVESGQSMMDRMDSFQGIESTGDRGNVVVDIPGKDILPYIASQPIDRSLLVARTGEQGRETDPWENLIKRNTGSGLDAMTEEKLAENSADFHSFETVSGQDDNLNVRRVHDIHLVPEQLESDSPLLLSVGSSLHYGPNQPKMVGSSIAIGSVGQADYLNRQMLTAPDGTSLAYGNTADYGKQHSSYIQQEVTTLLGTSGSKKLDTSEDVVYGKVSETPSAPRKRLEEELDSRLLEKLALLEESSAGKVGAQAVVTDLWSIMKQNGG